MAATAVKTTLTDYKVIIKTNAQHKTLELGAMSPEPSIRTRIKRCYKSPTGNTINATLPHTAGLGQVLHGRLIAV